MALALPEAVEQAHMGHPDFRVKGKVFATLGYPDGLWAMVKLTPEQQTAFVESEPGTFVPVKGGWGLKGATNVRLSVATRPALGPALATAWRNVAPRALVAAEAERPAARKGRKKVARDANACRRSQGLLLAGGALRLRIVQSGGGAGPSTVPGGLRRAACGGVAGGGTLELASRRHAGAPHRELLGPSLPQAGACWTTAVRLASAGTGLVTPVVTTRPFEPVTVAPAEE
jgi:hypothetical protein